jgi:serine/threonine-protein kinase
MMDGEGRVKIMDFGLARIEGTAHITQAGTTIGTTAYMAPEQLAGYDADIRSDIWAFGVVLYELFTGELPFKGAYEPAIMYSITEEDPVPVSQVAVDIPDHFDKVIARCLKKDRELRYQTFDEIINDLNGGSGTSGTALPKSRLLAKRLASSKASYLYVGIPVVLVLLVFMLYPLLKFSGWDLPGNSGLPAEQGLAILPFKNIGQSQLANMNVVSDGLLETLTSKLAQVDNYRGTLWVIPASEVIRGSVTTPGDARKEFSVNLAVTGSLQEVDEYLLFTMNLVNTKSMRQLNSREVRTNKDSLSVLQASAGRVLLEMLNIELKPEIDRAISQDQSQESLASQFYLQGRGYLLRYEEDDNLNNAIDAFQQAIKKDPDYALAYAALGESYWQKYQLTDDIKYVTQAKTALDRAMKINDKLVPVIATLGLINRGTGAYEEAVKNFRKVITLEPSNNMAFRELAGIYKEQGALDKAEENFKIAIRLKPDYWRGYNDLGLFYYQYRGQIDKAIVQFKEIVRLTPENYLGYSQLGAMYTLKGEYPKASELFGKSLAIKETFFAASNLGTIYYSMKNYHEAIKFYGIAYKLNANSYLVLGNLASVHEAVGNDDLAREYYLKAITLAESQLNVNPHDVEVINDLGAYYADIGENTQALKYLSRSVELDSNNVEVLYRTGAAYERMGDRESALKWMGTAIEKGYPVSDILNQPELQELVADNRFKEMSGKAEGQSQ